MFIGTAKIAEHVKYIEKKMDPVSKSSFWLSKENIVCVCSATNST